MDHISEDVSNESLKYNFKKGDYISMNKYLYMGSSVYSSNNINLAVEEFYKNVLKVFDLFVPIEISVYHSSSTPVWFSRSLKTLKNKKNYIHKKIKSY